jgi:hypothetical protein
MGKTVDSPKKFIISCRVDDNELEMLQHLAKRSGVNLSTLLRRSIDVLKCDAGAHSRRLSC